MVRIKPFPLFETATLRSPQNVVVSTRNGKMFATKWPRKRGPAKTPGAYYQQQTFGIAANWAANAEPANLAMAIEMAKETTMIPRDFLTAAAYGKILTITLPDGTQWERYWDVAVNAQLTLDQVTTTVGALIYRSPAGWIEVPPGPNGYYLAIIDNQPIWLPPPSPTPAATKRPFNGQFYATSSVAIAINSAGGCYFWLETGDTYNGVEFPSALLTTTSKVTPVVYNGNQLAPVTLVATGPQQSFATRGIQRLPFSAPWVVPTTAWYAVGYQLSGASLNQLNTPSSIPSWSGNATYPPPSTFGAYINSAANNVQKAWLY